MSSKTVLITGANGYIGYPVAKAFVRAGWTTYGLVRGENLLRELEKNEIHPLIGSASDLSFLKEIPDVRFDVVVSNTEDNRSVEAHIAHLKDVSTMLDVIGKQSRDAGIRPLMVFTSGCKDYGTMGAAKHGDAGLSPHTEDSPLNPPEVLRGRTNFSRKLLAGNDVFDAVVTRPTIVYGYSSSHYGNLFKMAQEAQSVLNIVGHSKAIMHSLHVDDCAEAYVCLAEHPNRNEVAGHAFNISNERYETVDEVCQALAKVYGLQLELEPPKSVVVFTTSIESLTNFSQWVSSEKLRRVTGWKERRQPFTAGMSRYRMAYGAYQ